MPWPLLHPGEDVCSLSFFHTHTMEQPRVTYFANGSYVPVALAELNLFLRDFRTGDETVTDPLLFDVPVEIQ